MERIVPAISFMFAVSLLAGCAPRYAANWEELRVGMSKPEVTRILGQPRSRWPSEQFQEEWSNVEFGKSERWVYGKKGFLGLNAWNDQVLWFWTDPDTFIVVFGRKGRVSKYDRPEQGRFAETQNFSGSS